MFIPSSVTRVPSREDGALFAHFVHSRGLNYPSSVTRVPSREDGALFAHFVRSRGLNYGVE
ncbi:hypothetical protein [Methanosarcina barkeri]|uniref:hypothetical protein n=1 Tax=Methanosarcina barkeri TaxID=2208 RepID=UPI0012D3AA8A|nr:hypothetical protein [Methanosarcina barkeri]